MQGDGSVTGTPRKTLFQKAVEKLEAERAGTQGSNMPSNPPGMRQTRAGGSAPEEEAPRKSTKRTRYSATSGGGGWGSQEYADNYKPDTSEKRRNQRRGTGARNQAPQVINVGQGITVGSGVQGGRWAAKNKPTMSSFGSNYKEQELELSAAAEKSTPVNTGDLDKNPPKPTGDSDGVPESALSDSETIVNNNGVVQKGRNLSTIARGDDNTPYLEGEDGLFHKLGLGTGVKINRSWSSTQLPGTETALYGGKPETRGFDSDGIGINTGAERQTLSKDLYNDGGAVTFEGEGREGLSGTSDKQRSMPGSGGESSGGQRNWMEKGPEDANMARRRAFLDAPNSMAGMRAVDAQLGRVRSGNDFFYANPNAGGEGESEFVKVSLADGRAHQNGQLSGQDLLAKHVSKVKESMPAESIVEGEFTQPPTDTPMTSANPADFPETSAFSPSDTAGKFSYDEDAERFSDPSFGY